MFKRVFQSISKTFSTREETRPPVATPPPAAPEKTAPPPVEKKGSLLEKLASQQPPVEKKKEVVAATPPPKLSPEEMCAVTPSMTKEQVRAQLALLYRRHNRATSSLDARMRVEAEKMLSAIVLVREKHFGPI